MRSTVFFGHVVGIYVRWIRSVDGAWNSISGQVRTTYESWRPLSLGRTIQPRIGPLPRLTIRLTSAVHLHPHPARYTPSKMNQLIFPPFCAGTNHLIRSTSRLLLAAPRCSPAWHRRNDSLIIGHLHHRGSLHRPMVIIAALARASSSTLRKTLRYSQRLVTIKPAK